MDVPLAATHKLRAEINTGKPFSHEILEQYEIPIVASVLKLYLLELPGKSTPSLEGYVIKVLTIGRFARLISRLRNCQDHLQHDCSLNERRCASFGHPVDPRPASPCEHCHARCDYHSLRPPN